MCNVNPIYYCVIWKLAENKYRAAIPDLNAEVHAESLGRIKTAVIELYQICMKQQLATKQTLPVMTTPRDLYEKYHRSDSFFGIIQVM